MLDHLTKRERARRNERAVSRHRKIAAEALAVLDASRTLSPEALHARFADAAGRAAADPARVGEALGLASAAAIATLDLVPREVQLVAASALLAGKTVELPTGEGKTLAAALAAAVAAVPEGGVHVLTVNDYLAARDDAWMGPLFERLGVTHGLVPGAGVSRGRGRAYRAQVTYASLPQAAFDHLRDGLRTSPWKRVQRAHHLAIVDEVDSLVVDAAATPFVLGAPDASASRLFETIVPRLTMLSRDVDYVVDAGRRSAWLTSRGETRVEEIARSLGALEQGTLFDPENIELLRVATHGLRAQAVLERDRDYLVRENGHVLPLDPWTGRALEGRRWAGGLHQAIEAKELLPVRPETAPSALCSVAGYLRVYKKRVGLTGTTHGIDEELEEVLGGRVVRVPPAVPSGRVDRPDAAFATQAEAFDALVRDAAGAHRVGRPVLAGVLSERAAEALARALRRDGIEPFVLTAKHEAREAEIVAGAGRLGAVTVATQLAGRGTDIRLGGAKSTPDEELAVKALGGLLVLGLERASARRVDMQLAGRAGRQGDPGESRFYVSLEDGNVVAHLAGREKDARPIAAAKGEAAIVKLVTEAQTRVEAREASARTEMRETDSVFEQQRRATLTLRRATLEGSPPTATAIDAPEPRIAELVRGAIGRFLAKMESIDRSRRNDVAEVAREMTTLFGVMIRPPVLRAEWDAPDALARRIALALTRQRGHLLETIRDVAESILENAGDREGALPPWLAGFVAREGGTASVLDALERAASKRFTSAGPRNAGRAWRALFRRALDEAWSQHLVGWNVLRDDLFLGGSRDRLVDLQRRAYQDLEAGFAASRGRAVARWLTAKELGGDFLRELEADDPQRRGLGLARTNEPEGTGGGNSGLAKK